MAAAEENKAQFRRTYEELLNGGDLSVADELVAPDFVNHEAPPGMDRGPDSMRGLSTMLRTAFPDLHFNSRRVGSRRRHRRGPSDHERHP